MVVLFALGPAAAGQPRTPLASPPKVANKIAPWVMEHTANGHQAEFLVMLADQADLSGAAALPSLAGQPQELIVISGALVGSPCAGVQLSGYGTRNHCMHSMYRAGVPFPWSMLRQPIHLAPGAIPIWLPIPSSPIAVPDGYAPAIAHSQV